MIALFFRYFFIIFCGLYVYFKITKTTYQHLFFISATTIYLFLSSYFTSQFIDYNIVCKMFFILITSSIYLFTLSTTNYFNTLLITIISYGISFGFYIISNIFVSVIVASVYVLPSYVPYNLTYFPVSIVQFLFIYSVVNNPQFRLGIFALLKKKITKLSIFLSLFLIIFIAIVSNKSDIKSSSKLYIVVLLLIFSFFLLYYWRHRIKQTYIENLRRLENLTYENTIADKDKQIKELEANNAYLAQIIHKYRKVIPAMELSVMELLQNNANWDTNTLKSNAQALQVQLEELRAERNNLLDNYQKDMVVTPQSGLHTIDALIALMEKQAKEQWVRYKTQIDPSIKELALASVKEADLLHLLGDLIENALHAVNESDHKEILIHISKLNSCLLLEVSDSGAAFDIETYQHFGNEPFTSHEADGGSGTGLMEIWKLKKEYKISLYIYEYEIDSNVYTKKISFLFDKKNHFLLKTFRDKEVKNALIRGDLHVFPHKND